MAARRLLVAVLLIRALEYDAFPFQNRLAHGGICRRHQKNQDFSSSSLGVLKEPRNDAFSSRQPDWFNEPLKRQCSNKKEGNRRSFSSPRRTTSRQSRFSSPIKKSRKKKRFCLEDAIRVEHTIATALELMREPVIVPDKSMHGQPTRIDFPHIRECNSALASFGRVDFARALRLFMKMRACASLAQRQGDRLQNIRIPMPTLVTYCTLMTRATSVGKPDLALRLWDLCKNQPEFWSRNSSAELVTSSTIVPDVQAANILMNTYAKLANYESAMELMNQMKYGNGTDVPAIQPNLVTYNTLLDSCHKAGELDAALAVRRQVLADRLVMPDACTYTSLIATVARKASRASGAHDPTLAFVLMKEMESQGIQPNGMTYSALIDACGRCRRSDLALKSLRKMLNKKQELLSVAKKSGEAGDEFILWSEVSAWTSAINALGKAGRIKTALKVFYSMDAHILPNTVTCGSLIDSLLRNGRTMETMDLITYMKKNGIAASEVIYTSLMTNAERLIKTGSGPQRTQAIDVYTALMKALTQGKNERRETRRLREQDRKGRQARQPSRKLDDRERLIRVFLVFQEMKAVGATPDVACYNALLGACARAGDYDRAQELMKRMRDDGLHPTDTTWKELLRATATIGRSDLAEVVWKQATSYAEKRRSLSRRDSAVIASWNPSVSSFSQLISAYLREAHLPQACQRDLWTRIVLMYKDVLTSSERQRVDKHELQRNAKAMLGILDAVVGLANLNQLNKKRHVVLRHMAIDIAALECFASSVFNPQHLTPGTSEHGRLRSLREAREWRRLSL